MRSMTTAPGPFAVDESSDFGARAARRLRSEIVVWLTTVAPSGTPVPNPVWYLWDGADQVLVHSVPDSARARHLADHPQVSLHVDGDGRGGDIVALSGLARPRPDAPPADADEAYLAKYADQIARIGHTPRSFAERYSLPVAITLTRLRGH